MTSRFFLAAVLLSTFALAAVGKLRAEPWSLVGCPPEGEARRQAFEHAVRTATPGSRVYVPKPYPATPRQVIADYLYQYKSLRRDRRDPKTLPANETAVLAGIMNSTVTYRVLRVENWTTMRCGTEKRRDFYYLLRVFDAASGVELSRAVIDHSGLFFLLSNTRDDQRAEPAERQRARLPEPAEALSELNARLGLRGESPQYVATYGSIDCGFASPCLAFRQTGRNYVLYKDEIFEIPADGKRLTTGKDVGTPETNAAVLAGLAPGERLISLGGPVWTIARKVDPGNLAQHRSSGRMRLHCEPCDHPSPRAPRMLLSGCGSWSAASRGLPSEDLSSIVSTTMDWPTFFPADCPYSHSSAANGEVYRLVKPIPRPEDFMSHRERFPDQSFSGPECELCGLSIILDIADLPGLKSLSPRLRKRVVARALLSSEHGLIAPTPKSFAPSHHTWWAPVGTDVQALFTIDTTEGS